MESAKALYTSILLNPDAAFEYALKGGENCMGYLKSIEEQKVVVLIYETGDKIGQIATLFVPTIKQLESLGF